MYTRTGFAGKAAAVGMAVALLVCLLSCLTTAKPAWAQALQAESAIAAQQASIDEVRMMIEALPAVSDVTKADGELIAQTRAAFDALSAEEQQLLDTETNRTALHTTQSYGRVLELAEAGYAVLFEVDNTTTLADGVYTTSVTTEWDRGKSASKQDRDWVARRVEVRDGKAYVTLGINSSTYSYLRASSITATRLASSGADESLFTFPVSVNEPMVFCAYSELMAAEIAYNLKVSIPAGAQPDAESGAGEGGGEGEGDEPAWVQVSDPEFTTDPDTGAVVVERGVFAHPEVKSQISPMFRIVEPALIYSDGSVMTVYATMPSQSYIYFSLGTAEQAREKSLADGIADGSFIEPWQTEIEKNGKSTTVNGFTFPLASLDEDLAVCLYSAKNKDWVNHIIRFNSADLAWHVNSDVEAQLHAAVDKLEALPARNTIVPDNAEHEAVVRQAREAYDALSRYQKAQVPNRLTLLLEWDESMFELGFNTEHLPLALVGQPYDGAVYVSGKNLEAGKSARVVSGSLPEGMSIEVDAEGRWAHFAGTPSEVGSSTFTIELSNGVETVAKKFTIHVGYAPRILTQSVADARNGVEYEQLFEADAYPDATWSLAEGTLPDGLAFIDDGESAGTARLQGTPTESGTFTFTLACDNFANGIETATYTLRVLPNDVESQVASLSKALEEVQAELARMREEANRNKSTIEGLKAKVAEIEVTNREIKTANDGLQKKTGELSGQVKKLKATEAKLKALQPKAVVVNVKTVTAKAVKAALKKAHNPYAKNITLGAKVKVIKKRAFASTDIRTITVKSTKLVKKKVKGSLKGSSVKTLKVPKAKKAAYKKAFAKANCGKKVTVK